MSWTVQAQTVDGIIFVCKLCYMATVIISEVFGDEFGAPTSAYGEKGSTEGREKQHACIDVEHVEDYIFAEVYEAGFDAYFKLLRSQYSVSLRAALTR